MTLKLSERLLNITCDGRMIIQLSEDIQDIAQGVRLLESQIKWVGVSDSLPITESEFTDRELTYKSVDVLVDCADGVFSAEFRCGGMPKFWFEFVVDGMVMGNTTHWMALPASHKDLS